MKRFASHYLYAPDTGFLKQQVVEMEGEYVVRFFPLTEEIESVEWLPGVIELTQVKDKFCAYLLFPFEFVDIMGFRFRCFVKNFFNLKFAKHLHLKVNDIEECESILNKEILLKCKCYGDIEIL